jgi:hypothetical protein
MGVKPLLLKGTQVLAGGGELKQIEGQGGDAVLVHQHLQTASVMGSLLEL